MTTKLTPVQEKITKYVAQYQAGHSGQFPSVVEVEPSEKKEAEYFLSMSEIKVQENKNVSIVQQTK